MWTHVAGGTAMWPKGNALTVFLSSTFTAYKDSRYSIHNFSSSDYTLMASPVSLKDEGMYECHHYHNTVANVTTKRFNVTVLGTLFCSGYPQNVKMASSVYWNLVYFWHNYGMSDVVFVMNPTGKPKITYTEHENSTIVKCSVNGRTPLKLSWRYKGGIEVEGKSQAISSILVSFQSLVWGPNALN